MTDQSVSVSRMAFLEALSLVALVAPRSGGSLPVVQSVRIAAEDGALRLTTTDFDRTVSVRVHADGADDFPTLLVPCHRLLAIVGQLPLGTLKLTPREKGLRVTADRARFDLAGLSADEFPDIERLGDRRATTTPIDAAAFTSALSRCATCCSNAPSRPTLNGVHVQAEKDGAVCLEATDGNHLAREWVERAAGPALDMIIPATSAPAIAKLFAGAADLTISISDERAVIASDDATRFMTKLIDGPYVNTASFFGQKMPREATVDRGALLTAVKRVAAVSVSDLLLIRMEWNADHVIVSGVNDDAVGTSEDVVPCSLTSGAPLRLCFGPRYIAHALALRSSETVRVGLKNESSMITLRDDDAPAIQSCLMPRRDPGEKSK